MCVPGGRVRMAVEMSEPRSRRALLAAAAGAAVATVASALGRPGLVSATDDEPVLVGGEYLSTKPTKFDTEGSGATALWGVSAAGNGLTGELGGAPSRACLGPAPSWTGAASKATTPCPATRVLSVGTTLGSAARARRSWVSSARAPRAPESRGSARKVTASKAAAGRTAASAEAASRTLACRA